MLSDPHGSFGARLPAAVKPPPVPGSLPNAPLNPSLGAGRERSDGGVTVVGHFPGQRQCTRVDHSSVVAPLYGCEQARTKAMHHCGKGGRGPGWAAEEWHRHTILVPLIQHEHHQAAALQSSAGGVHGTAYGQWFEVDFRIGTQSLNRPRGKRVGRDLEEDGDGDPACGGQQAGVPRAEVCREKDGAAACGLESLPVDRAAQQELEVSHRHTTNRTTKHRWCGIG